MSLVGNFTRLCQNPQLYLYAPSKENAMCFDGTALATRQASQSQSFGNLAAQPSGHYSPQAWIQPRTAGAVASRSLTFITLTLSGTGAEGLNAVGPSTISLNTYASGTMLYWGAGSSRFLLSGTGSILSLLPLIGNTNLSISGNMITNATGWLLGDSTVELITSGNGSLGIGAAGFADFAINATGEGTLLIGAAGNTTIYITSTGIMVSVVSIAGSAPMVVSAALTPEGLGWVNSTAIISLSSSMTPYATGNMVGTTADLTGLTTTSIADAVWQYSFGTATAKKTLEDVLVAVDAALALNQADQVHTAELITFRDRLTNALLLQKNVTGLKFGSGVMTMVG